MIDCYEITAWSKSEGREVVLFTWKGHPVWGVKKAEKEAKDFGLEEDLSDFAAVYVYSYEV